MPAAEPLLRPLSEALALLLLLEVGFVLARRMAGRLRLSGAFHPWALSLAALWFLNRAPDGSAPDLATRITATLAAVLSAIVVLGILDVAVLQRPWNRARGPMMPALLRGGLKFVIVVALALTCATVILGLDLRVVVASSTVLTAVVGFALQGVLKDVLAGAALQREGPFSIGDWLLVDGMPAEVIEMSWRSTHLRTPDGVNLYEPNATLSGARIANYGSGRQPVAWAFHVSLPHDAPPARVKQILLEAVRSAPGTAKEPAPEVFLDRYADSAVTYRVRAWTTEVRQLSRFIDGVNTRIWYQLRREEISLPFPTRTLHMHDAVHAEQRALAKDVDRVASLLASVDLFADLPAEAIRDLAVGARREHHDAGEILVEEGEAGDSLFLVDQGSVVVSRRRDGGGEPVELAVLHEGDFFGEASLLTGERRTATVVARDGCEVVVLARDAVAPVLAHAPELADSLSQVLALRAAATAAALEGSRRPGPAPTRDSIRARIVAWFGIG
jgi:small-conductance mechanosensitive channel/CRP-like cAMP-binding protein